ncbi:MAG TPA: SIS domain-containing protein, partial [Hanamia sp.]
MKYLEIEENVLEKKGAQLTAQEIVQQPRIWNDIYNLILNNKDKLQLFLEEAYDEVDSIILTGAGSSSFIGTSLSGTFFKNCGLNTKAVATTDLVTHPDNYFNKRKSILIISFARSGNSPESYAALELADEMSAKCFHLIITCNSQGNITLFKTDNPKFLLLLPPESNDQGLAMTSSYTGMLLAGTLVARINDFQSVYSQVNLLYKYGERIFQAYLPLIKSVAKKDFKRVIFLGSGALY